MLLRFPIIVLTILGFSFAPLQYTPAQEPNGKSEETETRERMLNWSRHLGVTCVHCHNLANFKDDLKPSFKVAQKHSDMVRVLQQEVFMERDKGNALKVKVDCYMCHRGKEIPAYIEPPNNLTK